MGTKGKGLCYENHTWINFDLKQLTREWSCGIAWNLLQWLNLSLLKLDGSSGISWSFLQRLKLRALRLESRVIPACMLLKWLPSRDNSSNDDRWQTWLRILPSFRLQLFRDNSTSEDRFQISLRIPWIPTSIILKSPTDDNSNDDREKLSLRMSLFMDNSFL